MLVHNCDEGTEQMQKQEAQDERLGASWRQRDKNVWAEWDWQEEMQLRRREPQEVRDERFTEQITRPY